MAAGNFNACHAVTAKWEGGWSNHKADPGGKTMYGVTQKTFDAWRDSIGKARAPVRGLTRHEAEEIYYRNYWRPVDGEDLAAGVDLAIYDYGVNSGPARARKALMRVGLQGIPVETVKRLCAQRRGFVRALATFKVFGKGWLNRIADVEARGVKMALLGRLADTAGRLVEEADSADNAAMQAKAQQNASGGAGGAGAAASVSLDQLGGDQTAALALLAGAALCIGLAVWFNWRKRAETARAAAFLSVATEPRR